MRVMKVKKGRVNLVFPLHILSHPKTIGVPSYSG
jgi:hypothetical protein